MRDVVVIGAGAAGLAATSVLRASGLDVDCLEAGGMAGGRARTMRHHILGPVDMGAQWIHGSDADNPLTAATSALNIHTSPYEVSMDMGGQEFSDAYAAFENALSDVSCEAMVGSVSSVLPLSVTSMPWFGTVEAFEGPCIAGARLSDIRCSDFLNTRLDGENLHVSSGMGNLLLNMYADVVAGISMGVRVLSVRTCAGGFSLSTDKGTVSTRSVICTVPLGAVDRIRWECGHETDGQLDAAGSMRMGHLLKMFMSCSPVIGDMMGKDTGLIRALAHGQDAIMFLGRPDGAGSVIGFAGGEHGRALSRLSIRDLQAQCLDALSAIIGPHDTRLLNPVLQFAPDWSGHTLFGGAYAHQRPDTTAGARERLAAPAFGGLLHFAGEACAAVHAGTVHGAIGSGLAAASALRLGLGLTEVRPSR